jgi:uncharacterized protein (DUF1330 family)
MNKTNTMNRMKPPLHLVVSIWIKKEQTAGFEEYERTAASIMELYGGRIEKAIRCSDADGSAGGPFEIHIVTFPDEDAFQAYRQDKHFLNLAALRQSVIVRTEINQGIEIPPYKSVFK